MLKLHLWKFNYMYIRGYRTVEYLQTAPQFSMMLWTVSITRNGEQWLASSPAPALRLAATCCSVLAADASLVCCCNTATHHDVINRIVCTAATHHDVINRRVCTTVTHHDVIISRMACSTSTYYDVSKRAVKHTTFVQYGALRHRSAVVCFYNDLPIVEMLW